MKKVISLICISLLVALYSCDERDDMRSDIDDLRERVAKLEAGIEQMNADISNYQQMLEGKILVMGYKKDEQDNYTIELSNGETVTVYSGRVDMDDMPLFGVNASGHWTYTINSITTELLVNGKPVNAIPEKGEEGATPKMKVDAQGFWLISMDGGNTWERLGNNQIADGTQATASKSSIFSNVVVDEATGQITFTIRADNSTVTVPIYGKDFHLTIRCEETPVFGLGQKQMFEVEQANVETAVIENQTWKIKLEETKLIVTAPSVNPRGEAYDDVIYIKIFSKEGYCRVVKLPVRLLATAIDANSATAWTHFKTGSGENVLLDYSYAGYNHGESAPQGAFSLGYQVFDVKKRMTDKNMTARRALLDILEENNMVRTKNPSAIKPNARIVIYFPAGDYVLHNEDDNTYDAAKQTDALDSKGNNVSTGIEIYAGNFVIKGDGPDKTRLIMETPNLPVSVSNTGSSPVLLTVKHTNSPNNANNSRLLASVTENAARGAFTVNVDGTAGINAGSWVQLRLRSGNRELVQSEIGPMALNANWAIAQTPAYMDASDRYGVKITEFHQVKSKSGNSVTFYESIMHDINTSYNDAGGWEIREYKYMENVGVEDISFVGNALDGFSHHGDDANVDKSKFGWQFDGAYKPLVLSRVVNSWVRNVNFESVSEALSLVEAANCSAFNIRISGNRGHSAVRAQGSSRVFIGKVRDESAGNDSKGMPCRGQFHGCGASKPSIGTVLWNVSWGSDACFEAHASQPRATLIDKCSGGLVYYRAGGDENEVPNHLSDLTLWNLKVTGTDGHAADFSWWNDNDKWWKLYPPIVVGLHGNNVTFSKTNGRQLTYEESIGTAVTPESLYEAQLQARLGYVPAWLNAIK